MLTCERCRHENPDTSRFCSNCGASLTTSGDDGAALKVVTVLFADVVESTALGERLDPEALREVLSPYFGHISATIERHGGTVQKWAGDAVLAVFGIPQVHEDDPLRAVRSAVEIQQGLPSIEAEVGVPIRLRIGLNTGLVITDDAKNLALGDAVNVAARLEQAANPGEILLGAQTLRLVRDAVQAEPLEPLTLKGKSEPVEAYRLLEVDLLARGVERRLDLPLVNRRRELALLRDVWDRTMNEGRCHLLMLLGAAGVGKSRVAEELFRAVGQSVTILRGRCLHYGEGITFWPILEALSTAGEPAEALVARVSEATAGTAEELFLAVRQLLESMARERPVILHVDDVQWAEPMLVDLLLHIASLSTGAPILILCTARPDLLDEHDAWRRARNNVVLVELDPLVPADCEQLLDQLSPNLDADTRAQVVHTSEGNPLFVQEMVALAEEEGLGQVPMTIQSLLTARIERLEPSERELLARGAVEGQVFHRSTLSALGEGRSAAGFETQLLELIRKDLIRPHRTDLPGDSAFRFRHLLIRDVAYERLPRARRAELHERYAYWLEELGTTVAEHEELAGWHLEQAVHDRQRARRTVEPRVMRRAAEHLHSAARRAADRGDIVASRKLLERAFSLSPADDILRVEVTATLAERLVEIGELSEAEELLGRAEEHHLEDPSLSLSRLLWMVHVRYDEAREIYERDVERILRELDQAGNDRGVANMHMLGFWMEWMASRAMPAADQARLAAMHARKAGDLALRSRALGWYVATLVFGPADVETMAAELDRLEAEHPGAYLRSFIDLGRGDVERLRGNFELAVSLTCQAREEFRSLGISTMAATCEQSLGWIELAAGDAATARDSLRRSDAVLSEFGERSIRSTTQAMLALAEQLLGHADGAMQAVEQAETLSSPADLLNYTLTHGVRARLAQAAGELAEAERWARSAVTYAHGTDFLSYQGQARLLLAEVLAHARRDQEARSEADAARQLFEAKGDAPGRSAAESLLARLHGQKPHSSSR